MRVSDFEAAKANFVSDGRSVLTTPEGATILKIAALDGAVATIFIQPTETAVAQEIARSIDGITVAEPELTITPAKNITQARQMAEQQAIRLMRYCAGLSA